ncbi:RloB domain-containing protein [Streptomyces sp. NPDC005202]|uniref:RloB domain-containing protein n=1 Tax=Streptomyces sp. NPDC005202 TaxID=3157021 RepID=UPI0033BD9C0E
MFTEGEVTEPEYIDIIVKNGVPAQAGRTVQHHIENPNAEGKHRKPLRMVQDAVRTLRKVEREAKDAGLRERDWNWPQVWVLFDRDDYLACMRLGTTLATSAPARSCSASSATTSRPSSWEKAATLKGALVGSLLAGRG